MTDAQSPPDNELKRIIVLIYGLLENGQPFWTFAAVRPLRYQDFLMAHKENKINLYQFIDFGEIIVSGEGRSPPDDITLKVAEMYQTDPASLMQAMQEENQKTSDS